jgi:hypothetical protein
VLHLPAPHIWQIAPAAVGTAGAGAPALVLTLELHIRRDAPDDGVLQLTRWAGERCRGALRARGEGSGQGVEVTIGVVRG